MKIGYLLDTHGGPYDMAPPSREQVSSFLDQLLREAELVEDLGFDSLLVPERHGRPETFVPTPLLLLSALAVRTTRIRLGTYILLLPLHDPVHVAEQFATIDQLSRGERFLVSRRVITPVTVRCSTSPITSAAPASRKPSRW